MEKYMKVEMYCVEVAHCLRGCEAIASAVAQFDSFMLRILPEHHLSLPCMSALSGAYLSPLWSERRC
jgi:hypothetical protein